MKKRFLLTFLSIITTVVFCELGVRIFIKPRSSGISTGALSNQWFKENVSINSQGYRDSEFSIKNRDNAIIMIGDSFTFGQGIRQNQTYFSITKNKITNKESYNLGKNGDNTIGELERLITIINKYSVKPTDVIFQYYFNDIDYLTKFTSSNTNKRNFLHTPQLIHFANYSFLFDYLYHPFLYGSFSSEYSNSLFSSYEDRKILAKHFSDIKRVYSFVKDLGSNFHFLAFPNINNKEFLNKSQTTYISKLRSFYLNECAKGDSWIDVSKLLLKMDANEWKVSRVDGHPSAKVHMGIGMILVDAINGNENEFIHFHN